MKRYSVVLNGENFWLELDGMCKKYGFFTTRYVEASDEIEAEKIAVALVKRDEDLKKSVRNVKDDLPMLYLESIEEVENFDGLKAPGAGFSFYAEDQ